MKKVLLTLALAAFAFAANAQFVVGGQINYNTFGGNETNTNVTGTTTTTWTMPGDNTFNENTSSLTILPKIGYNLDEKMQVGIAFGMAWDKTVDYSMWAAEYTTIDGFEGWQKTTQSRIVLAPYFRYNLMQFGDFTLFCEAQLSLGFGLNPKVHNYNVAYTDPILGAVAAVDEDVEGFKNTFTDINLSIVPGLNYKLNDKISADLYLNVAALVFNHRTEKTFRDWNVILNMPDGTPANTDEIVYTTNDFGFRANMNAVYDITNLFSIGFNYHF